MKKTPTKVVYIVADNRSGSTLLDQLLAANRRVTSVGEIHHLAAYALQDRQLFNPRQPLVCNCGALLTDCEFWTNVQKDMEKPLQSLRLRLRILGNTNPGPIGSLLKRLSKRYLDVSPTRFCNTPISRIFGARQVAADSFALFDSIAEVTNSDHIVDSSKSAFRFRALYERHPERMRVIVLARDYRATVHSKMKRGRDLDSSIRGWVKRMRAADAMTEDVPDEQRIMLRHEDLCDEPEQSMRRICTFLRIDYCSEMLTRPSGNIHGLGGSPSKFDPEKRTIRLDRSYLTAFSDADLAAMKTIVGKTAAKWGYA